MDFVIVIFSRPSYGQGIGALEHPLVCGSTWGRGTEQVILFFIHCR